MRKVMIIGSLLAALPLMAGAFRPPAVPLVSVDPFFSIWSAADKLTDAETTHWSGPQMPVGVTLTADGKTWRLCGRAPENVPALPQTGVTVKPLESVYTFAEGALKVELTFATAKLADDLDVFSRPVAYVTARVAGAKDWKLNAQISPALARNDDRVAMVTNTCTVAGLPAISIGRKEQKALAYSADHARIDWGYAWLVGPSAAKDGEAHFLLAYDDIWAVQFFGENLPDWWRRDGLKFTSMLAQAEVQRADVLKRVAAFDAELWADLVKVGGVKYAELASLAYRQTYAACKLAADRNNQPLYFSKENDSNGCIGTVDILYPQSPQMLLMSPTLMRAMLAPVLVYASHPRWPWPFAPHDLGRYPLANKQRYAGGETSKRESALMPVEECGNMIITLAALAEIEGTAEFAAGWWPTVTKWIQYLEKFGFDPGNQLCTDDFAGHLAHNANLAAKSIVAMACYARLAEKLGDAAAARKYGQLAKDLVPKWMDAAKGGAAGSYRLAYDRPGSWSMKYNLAWDRVLGLNLFPKEVYENEMKAYRQLVQPFGLPLDNRRLWTKTDWELWCATFTGRKDDFDCIVDRVWRFAHETPSRVAFSDWYWTDKGKYVHFIGRSVIGGVFMPMLCDRGLWQKYASRDKAKTRLYAPLKASAQAKLDFLVPEGRNAKDAEWKYTTEKPADGWEKPGFDDRAWKTGVGGFGTKGTPGAKIGTTWNTSDIWLRRHVKLAAAPKAEDGLLLSLHHDEDTEVFFNGVRAGAFPGYTSSYEQFPVPAAAKAALKAGDNVLASVTHQTMGGQYVDWGVAKASAGDAFNLATFNIRCPADTEDNAWSNRLPRVVQVIRKHAFDIFGVQEATPMQRKNLDAALPDFARVGLGRGTNDTGEAMCIYYRKNRFECLATDTFWLSETPREPGSKGWNAACPRTCTWGLFRDKKTGLSFRYFNTHLDHVSPAARVAGMKILLAEMARVAQGETVMLTGDLNDSFERIPPEEQKRLLKGNGPQISSEVTFEHPIANASQTLYDTLFRTEKPHEGTLKTFHAYQPTHHCRIDYVFATGNVRVLRHVTCNDRPDGKYPSDHDAVMVQLEIR